MGKYYIFGDTHLREDRENVTWEHNGRELLKFFQNFPKTSGVAIHVGDFFDSTKHRGVINKLACDIAGAMAAVFDQVIFVTGNHEHSMFSGNNMLVLQTQKVAVVSSFQVVKVGDDSLLFLPHSPYEKTQDLVNAWDGLEIDYVFGHHFYEKNAFGDKFIDISSLNYKKSFMGHSHKYEVISPKDICVGSMWACTKGERDYDFGYEVFDGKTSVHTPYACDFLKFVETTYVKDQEIQVTPNTLYVVNVSCARKNKVELETVIRAKLGKQLYEIIWDIKEETKDILIEAKSNDDLVSGFFKEYKVSKNVKVLCESYLGAK